MGKTWYMARGLPKVGAPVPIGLAVMATPRPSQSYCGHTQFVPTLVSSHYMDVSKNRGTPKWMVNNGKPY